MILQTNYSFNNTWQDKSRNLIYKLDITFNACNTTYFEDSLFKKVEDEEEIKRVFGDGFYTDMEARGKVKVLTAVFYVFLSSFGM